ncbi:dephospho-CoA kinase [Paenibacillus sp. YN15]|uniref:dephospho-CoA kinase n=1 Tax=Paenibacillus sp. YN15 TaxID=1742774 RepID=UPI000DCB4178|nr:dephospho-CoA kinase [Paenibacillus sp. YN15]RAV06595.1 dephospho-CoA kinase [Paenibacillus sp. YN15]
MNIGLTGGIACGKSTVSRLLASRGAIVIDADILAREVVEPGAPALLEVVRTFGQSVLHEDGTLNRKELGKLVFEDEARRKRLEELLHPAIIQLLQERMAEAERLQPDKLVVADVPLLYEAQMEDLFQEVLVVAADRGVQLERLMTRNGLSREEAEQRINAQMPIEWKKEWADTVIDNSGTPEETERQVEAFWRKKRLA